MIFDFWDELDLEKFNRYFKTLFVIVIVSFGLFGVIGG